MLWMEGFEGAGTIAALATKITFSNTSELSLVSALSGAGSALVCTGPAANRDMTVAFTDTSELYLQCKIKWNNSVATPVTTFPFFRFATGGTVQDSLYLDNSGTILEARLSTTSAHSTCTVIPNTVYSLGIYLKIADSGGRFVVYLDGAAVIDYTGDTKASSSITTVNNVIIRLGAYVNASTKTDVTIDHLVISDFAIPDCNIVTLRPTEDGNYTQFTPSTGTDHYALVDETTLDTGDYNASSTSGHRDSFKFAEPTFNGEIKGAALEFYVNKSDAGARAIRGFVRQGGTDYDGAANLALTEAGNIASHYMETNPATSAAFTVAQLTGASRTEFGIKVQS